VSANFPRELGKPLADFINATAPLVARGPGSIDEDEVEEFWLGVREWCLSTARRKFALCSPAFDSEDLCEEALLRIFVGMPRWEGRSSFISWAYRVLLNTWATALRKMKGERNVSDPLADPECKDQSATIEARIEVSRCLECLTENEARVLRLAKGEELTANEIGIILDLNPATVRSLVKRALDKIRKTSAPE
jgi:RNA polymerase sigma factor (sigma-70 family)